MASSAPTRVLMCLPAQRPKAEAPPALFIRATIMPSTTRKTMMPTFQESAKLVMMPPSEKKMPLKKVSKLNFPSAKPKKKFPRMMPIRREE